MVEWLRVGEVSDFEEGKGKMVEGQAGYSLAVFRVDGDFFAINHICPHQGGPLSDGVVTGDKSVACPLHGWEFDLETGQSVNHEGRVDTFDVKVEDGNVYVGGLDKKGCGCSCGNGGCC